MARTNSLTNYLTDVAQAIKNKKGDQTPIKASDFDTEITNLPSGGGDLSEYFNTQIESDGKTLNYTLGKWVNCLKKIKIENVTTNTFGYLFRGYMGEAIDISSLDMNNATTLNYMFSGCTNIKELDFSQNSLPNLSNIRFLCENCSNLETLNIGNFDFSDFRGTSAGTVDNFITGCSSLKNLTFGTNLGKSFTTSSHATLSKVTLSGSPLLTHDSLMSVINNLYDLTGRSTQDLVLGETNLAKLTPEEIAIATNKNWTVS